MRIFTIAMLFSLLPFITAKRHACYYDKSATNCKGRGACRWSLQIGEVLRQPVAGSPREVNQFDFTIDKGDRGQIVGIYAPISDSNGQLQLNQTSRYTEKCQKIDWMNSGLSVYRTNMPTEMVEMIGDKINTAARKHTAGGPWASRDEIEKLQAKSDIKYVNVNAVKIGGKFYKIPQSQGAPGSAFLGNIFDSRYSDSHIIGIYGMGDKDLLH